MASTGFKIFMFMLMTNLIIYGFAIDVGQNTEPGSTLRNYQLGDDGEGTMGKVAVAFGYNIDTDNWNTTPLNYTGSGTLEDSISTDETSSNFVSGLNIIWTGLGTLRSVIGIVLGFVAAPILLTTQMNAPPMFTLLFGIGFTVMFIFSLVLMFLGKD